MVKRIESKKPNVYKVEISVIGLGIIYQLFTSSVIKCERCIDEWVDINIDSPSEVIISGLGVGFKDSVWGKHIATGSVNIIEDDSSYNVEVYKIHIL